MERRKRMNESKLGMRTSGGELQRGVRFSRFYCRKRDELAHVQWSLIGVENEKGPRNHVENRVNEVYMIGSVYSKSFQRNGIGCVDSLFMKGIILLSFCYACVHNRLECLGHVRDAPIVSFAPNHSHRSEFGANYLYPQFHLGIGETRPVLTITNPKSYACQPQC